MSDRERWTVYPLLFSALGIAAKDKVFRQLEVDQVSCKSLVVKDRENRDRVVLDTDPGGGRVRVKGNRDLSIVLGYQNNLAGLMFADPRGGIVINRGVFMPTRPLTRPQNAQPKPAANPEPANLPGEEPKPE